MAPPAAASPQFLSIQVLRAVAALGVIYQHIQYDFTVKFGIANFPPSLGVTDLGVDLFFVISGFIIVYASESLFEQRGGWKEFAKRRVIRIVPIYWATSLLALAYILLRQRESDLQPLVDFVKWVAATFIFLPYPRTNGEMVPINGVGWTLNYEMFFYLVFAVAVCLPRRRAVMAVSLLFIALALAGIILKPLANPWAFWCDSVILEFVLGMAIALALREGVALPRWFCRMTLVFGLSAYVVIGFLGTGDTGLPRLVVWGLPAGLIVAGLTLAKEPRRDRTPSDFVRLLGFLGDASYSIYLLHPFMLAAPRLLQFGLGGEDVVAPSSPWIYAAMQFVLAVGGGVALHVLFERPITRLLRGRAGPRGPVAGKAAA